MEDTKEYINTLFERFKDITNRNKDDIKNLTCYCNEEFKEVRDKLSKLENRQSISETNIEAITKKLDNISADLTWLKRAVIGAIVVQLMQMLVGGG